MSEGKSGPIGANRASKGKSNSHRAGEVASIELPAGRARRQDDKWPSHAPTSATHRLKVRDRIRDRIGDTQVPTSRRRVVHGSPPGYPATAQDGEEMDGGVLGSPHRGSPVQGAQGAIPTDLGELGWC